MGLKKNPNYEEDSRRIAEEAKAMWRKATAEAGEIISHNLAKSANTLAELLQANSSPEEVPALKLKADIAKHFLKLGGLEVDKHQHSNDPENPIQIFLPPQDGGERA